MSESSRGLRNGEGSSALGRHQGSQQSLNDFDDGEGADLSLDNALLADDPLEGEGDRTPLVLGISLRST